jgi:hypothetical protein
MCFSASANVLPIILPLKPSQVFSVQMKSVLYQTKNPQSIISTSTSRHFLTSNPKHIFVQFFSHWSYNSGRKSPCSRKKRLKVSAAALMQQAGKIASFCSNHKKKSSNHKPITNFYTI